MIKILLLLSFSFNCLAEVVDECGVNFEDQPNVMEGGCFEIREDGVYRSHVAMIGDEYVSQIYLSNENVEGFLNEYERID